MFINITRSRFGILPCVATGVLAAASALAGCSGVGDEATAEVRDPIIAGVPANGAALNAIGSVGYAYYDDYYGAWQYQPYCSGSLIGKQAVLTAKHCVAFFESDAQYGYKTMFAIGPNALAPQRLVEVVAVQRAPGNVGGFVGYGRDVGVMHLLEKVTDLTPLKVGTLTDASVGKTYVDIGYGVRDNTGAAGTRRAGNVTLRALHGKVFEVIFGSFERFKAWYDTGSPETQALFQTGPVAPGAFLPLARSLWASGVGHDIGAAGEAAGGTSAGGSGPVGGTAPTEGGEGPGVGGEGPGGAGGTGGHDPDAYLRFIYDNTVLDEGYEAVVGGATGDAQACYGDSGSPIVKVSSSGVITAYGVVSGGLGSDKLICDFGGVDAIFGPDVKSFLTAAAKWVDPCKGLSVEGICSGTTAKRCTGPNEGPRRLVSFNCASIAQTCAIQPDGTAGCSDP